MRKFLAALFAAVSLLSAHAQFGSFGDAPVEITADGDTRFNQGVAIAEDNRRFVEAVLYRYRAGLPWRDLPERFGDWKNTHRRFSRWAATGVWARLFQHLAADADNEYAMIDSTIVRAHQHSAGAQKNPARTRQSGVRAVD